MSSTHPLYPNMVFPDYEFREYPKWVTPEGGEPVLVNDASEEAEVLQTGEVLRDEDAKADVIAELTAKGVQFDKRWGLARLQKALAEA